MINVALSKNVDHYLPVTFMLNGFLLWRFNVVIQAV